MRLAFMLFSPWLLATGMAQQYKTAPLTTYTDKENGISFQYPSVWHHPAESAGFSPPMVFGESAGVSDTAVPVRFGVVFTPEGNFHEQTTLEGLGFFYGVVRHSSPAACAKIPATVSEDGKVTPRVISGIPLITGKGGQGSTGHFIDANVYTTLRNGRCFVFEADTDTNPGRIGEGIRDLTSAEVKALARHMDGIVQSIHFSAAKR